MNIWKLLDRTDLIKVHPGAAGGSAARDGMLFETSSRIPRDEIRFYDSDGKLVGRLRVVDDGDRRMMKTDPDPQLRDYDDTQSAVDVIKDHFNLGFDDARSGELLLRSASRGYRAGWMAHRKTQTGTLWHRFSSLFG